MSEPLAEIKLGEYPVTYNGKPFGVMKIKATITATFESLNLDCQDSKPPQPASCPTPARQG